MSTTSAPHNVIMNSLLNDDRSSLYSEKDEETQEKESPPLSPNQVMDPQHSDALQKKISDLLNTPPQSPTTSTEVKISPSLLNSTAFNDALRKARMSKRNSLNSQKHSMALYAIDKLLTECQDFVEELLVKEDEPLSQATLQRCSPSKKKFLEQDKLARSMSWSKSKSSEYLLKKKDGSIRSRLKKIMVAHTFTRQQEDEEDEEDDTLSIVSDYLLNGSSEYVNINFERKDYSQQREELKDSAFEDSHDTLSYDRKSETASKSPCLSELSVNAIETRSVTPPARTSSRDFMANNVSRTSLNVVQHLRNSSLGHERNKSSIGSEVGVQVMKKTSQSSLQSPKRSFSSHRLSFTSNKRLSKGPMRSKKSCSPKRKKRFSFFKRWFPRKYNKRKSLVVGSSKSSSSACNLNSPTLTNQESPLVQEEKLIQETADSPALSCVVESIRNFSISDPAHNYSLVNLASLARSYHNDSSTLSINEDHIGRKGQSASAIEEVDLESEYAHKVEMVHDPSSTLSPSLQGSQAEIQDVTHSSNLLLVNKSASTNDLSLLSVNESQTNRHLDLPLRKSSSESIDIVTEPKRSSKFTMFTWTKGEKKKTFGRQRRSVLHLFF